MNRRPEIRDYILLRGSAPIPETQLRHIDPGWIVLFPAAPTLPLQAHFCSLLLLTIVCRFKLLCLLSPRFVDLPHHPP
jgi:hypothetical protein